jgi:hypothetical protein
MEENALVVLLDGCGLQQQMGRGLSSTVTDCYYGPLTTVLWLN